MMPSNFDFSIDTVVHVIFDFLIRGKRINASCCSAISLVASSHDTWPKIRKDPGGPFL